LTTAASSNAPSDMGGARQLSVVMLVNRVMHGGGAERAMVALATHLPRDRFAVTVVTTRRCGGPLLDTLLAAGVRHVPLRRWGRFDLAPFRHLIALLRAERIDIVHAHMFGSNFWGTVFGRLARVPVVVAHEHSWSYEGQPIRRWVDGHVIGRLADAFVAVSERDRARMTNVEGVPPEKSIVLPNPYLPGPPSESVNVREQLRIPPAAPLIATVAMLRPEKAHEVLLEAFAELSATMRDAVLVIGGEGPRREALERHARKLGISDRVRFMGWCQDVGGLLEAADVAVISSDREGAPLFALECMAHMAPLVSTDVGNVSELLGEGEGVVTVPRRDPPALARAVAALLRDPQRRAAQARAAADRLAPYELDNVVREFVQLYDRLLEAALERRTRNRGPNRSTGAWLTSLIRAGTGGSERR
jgi:glycosyltransferase involved in cell wall biosynthesis